MMSPDEKFGYPEAETPEIDETGTFSVRVVYLDGVERLTPEIESLREALLAADEHRQALAVLGYDHHRVHLDVIDMNDPERGSLDWDTLNEKGPR